MIFNRRRLIVVVVAIGGMSLAAFNPAVAELAARDLNGRANLSAADRTSFIDKCVARRTDLFAYWFSQNTSIKPEEIQELRSDIDETFPRLCGCLARELEKDVSKLQFLMAETMIEQGTYPDYPGSPIPEFDALKAPAARLGMSAPDFEAARQKFRTHSSRAAEACSLTLSAPSLARRMGIPELRSYSGPPEQTKDEPEIAKLKAEKLIEDQAARAYSLCLEGRARNLSYKTNDPPEAIGRAAFALCATNRQMIPDAYRGHTNSFNSEMMSALEEVFQRKLPQIVIKTRELRDAQPTPAPTKP
jgi:hypothetical protein